MKNKVSGNPLKILLSRMLPTRDECLDFFIYLFTNMPSGVVLTSAQDHTVIYANTAWLNMFCYDLDHILEKRIDDLVISPFEKEEKINAIARTAEVEAGNILHFKAVRNTSEGSSIHVEITVVPIYISAQLLCFLSFYTDISAQVAAQQELKTLVKDQEQTIRERTRELEKQKKLFFDKSNELESLLETMGEAVFVEDPNGILTYVNRAAIDLLGFPKAYMLNKNSLFFVDQKQQTEVNRHIEARIRSGEPSHYETVLVGNGGRRIDVLITAKTRVDNDSRRIGTIATLTDITAIKKIQKDLKSATQAAEAANRAKSEFLANMSHEIRTPMNGVMGMTGLLLDTELDDEQREMLRTVQKCADGLLVVINDILDFSKIEAGKLEVEEMDFNLRNMMDDAIRFLALKAHEKGLEIVYEIGEKVPTFVTGDPGRIRQVLTNLVGNAVKFTEDGLIHIRARLAADRKDHALVEFSVTDQGIGIEKKDLKKLFKSFHQADASTTRKFGGTGLGLAISRQLTELMGGTIQAKSRPGIGSTFTFTVLLKKQADAVEKIKYPLKDMHGMEVLIVDDMPVNIYVLRKFLEAWGFIVHDADGAKNGLKMAQLSASHGKPFPLVIADCNMPEFDGAFFGREIRKNPAYRQSRLIMLTSRGVKGDYEKMKKIGFDAYLTKPVRESTLFDTIAMVLSGSKPEPQSDHKKMITRHTVLENRIRKTRILVVEDNPVNQKVVTMQLVKIGFSVDVAPDGHTALEKLGANDYDLVLMDRQMPGMDGVACTKHIRAGDFNIKQPTIPIIALTADVMKDAQRICEEAGMNDYVPKPIKLDELLKRIKHVLWPDAENRTPSPLS